MTMIIVQPGESIELALRRFKKALQKDGTQYESRRREYFVPPSQARRTKSARAQKRKAA